MKLVGIFETHGNVRVPCPAGISRRVTRVVGVDEDGRLFHLCHDARDGEQRIINAWVQSEETSVHELGAFDPGADFILLIPHPSSDG